MQIPMSVSLPDIQVLIEVEDGLIVSSSYTTDLDNSSSSLWHAPPSCRGLSFSETRTIDGAIAVLAC
jgi:hypothetical protein